MAFVDDFPLALPSSSDPANFDPRADAYYGHLPTFVAQLNALANLLATACAPPLSLGYMFDASTTVGDPGPGKIRLNAATQTSATAALIDLVDGVGVTVTGLLDQFGVGTSVIKGYLRVNAVADPKKWLVFAATAVASPTGYRNITIQSGVGSSASPFVDTDLVTVSFVPKGDKGDTGANGPWTGVLSAAPISGTPSTVTFSSIPTGYADLRFPYAVNLSTSAGLTVALSADGSTFSSPQPFTDNSSNAYAGELFIADYLSDRPSVRGIPGSNGSSPALAMGTLYNYGGTGVVNGGVKAVRFGTTSGTFNGGSFFQPRAR